MRTVAVALPVLLALVTPLGAQGVISDGPVSFEWGGNTVGSAHLIPYTGGSDQLGVFWWWYRLDTDVLETEFPYPPAGTYDGDTHTVTYDLPVFSADFETTISVGPIPDFQAILTSTVTVTNTSGGPISISLFNAADVNVQDSAGNDFAFLALPTPPIITIDDDSDDFCQYGGIDAEEFSVANFPGVIDDLTDSDLDDFESLGLPSSGDFTGGFQRTFDLDPGASASMCVTFAVNTNVPVTCGGGPPPTPNFVRGDFDGNAVFNALVDSLAYLAFGFQGGPPPVCFESADADGDGVSNALVDVLFMLAHGFQGGPAPGAPYPACGPDPDPGTSLGCDPNACP